jgi:hypothetical protein
MNEGRPWNTFKIGEEAVLLAKIAIFLYVCLALFDLIRQAAEGGPVNRTNGEGEKTIDPTPAGKKTRAQRSMTKLEVVADRSSSCRGYITRALMSVIYVSTTTIRASNDRELSYSFPGRAPERVARKCSFWPSLLRDYQPFDRELTINTVVVKN